MEHIINLGNILNALRYPLRIHDNAHNVYYIPGWPLVPGECF